MTTTTARSRGSRAAERRDRADATDRRRFVLALLVFAVGFAVLGRMFGEAIALQLERTPTTELGWRLIGWLVVGPPAVFVLVMWHERGRLTADQRRDRGLMLAAWIGASMFILPARLLGVQNQFGTAAVVGDPLSEGWAWGALGAVLGLGFTVVVLVVFRRTVESPTQEQRDLTARFLEHAWVVVLLVSLGFALYGNGVLHGGT